MADIVISTELSKSLVYLVAPNAGDNYWARIINGCDKIYTPEGGTLSVSLTPQGKYILTCHTPFFDSISVPMRKLGLIHEAGHVALRHIERYMRVVAQQHNKVIRAAAGTVYNWAADFAVNDAIVRLEREFTRVHKPRGSDKGEWTFLVPEEWGFTRGKSMEFYLRALTNNLEDIYEEVKKLLQRMDAEADGEEGEGDGIPMPGFGKGKSLPSDGEDGAGDGEGESEGKGKGGKKGKGKGKSPGEEDNSLPKGLVGKAFDSPEMFETLQKFFDRVNHENHKEWMKVAEQMTAEEAMSAANKMKQHAKRLVRSAHEQTMKSRGFVPGEISKLVDNLLQEDPEPWDGIFADIVATSVSTRVIEEMAMPNQSLLALDDVEPWPGNMLDFQFNVTWMRDSSGSVSDREYARGAMRFNSLLAMNKNIKVTYVECDAALQKEVTVENVNPDPEAIDQIKMRQGYGGTVFTPFFRRIHNRDTPQDWVGGRRPENLGEHPKPDLIIIVTDGYVGIKGECLPEYRPACGIIWLILPGGKVADGMDNSPPDHVIEMFHIKPEFDEA